MSAEENKEEIKEPRKPLFSESAYTSVKSEKIPANHARSFLFRVGAVKYAEIAELWAERYKPREHWENTLSTGMSVTDIKQQIDVKNRPI